MALLRFCLKSGALGVNAGATLHKLRPVLCPALKLQLLRLVGNVMIGAFELPEADQQFIMDIGMVLVHDPSLEAEKVDALLAQLQARLSSRDARHNGAGV